MEAGTGIHGWHATPEQTAVMQAIGRLISLGVVPEYFSEVAAVRVAEVVHDGAVITLLSEDGRTLRTIAAYHPDAAIRAQLVGAERSATQGHEAEALAQGHTVLVTAHDGPEPDEGDRGTLPAVVVPMRSRGHPVGILCVFREAHAPDFDCDEIAFVEDIAGRLALGVDVARLSEALTMEHELSERPASPSEHVHVGEQLTEREEQILEMLIGGMTNRQIADRLVLSVRTVEWHRSRIQTKLGAKDRADLVAIARRMYAKPD